jgi:hypothetical protein
VVRGEGNGEVIGVVTEVQEAPDDCFDGADEEGPAASVVDNLASDGLFCVVKVRETPVAAWRVSAGTVRRSAPK